MILNKLKKYQDLKYLEFNKKIIKSNQQMIGVRVPILRKLAKDLNFTNFLKNYKGNLYEETLIYGISLSNLHDIKEIKKHLLLYSTEIKDWSQCDIPANNLKIIKKNQQYFIAPIEKMLNSNKEFEIRFALVLLLFHYIDDNNIDYILNIAINLKTDKYYINMALAWLLCECFIKYREKTISYISSEHLSKFVLNKTISKINDSYRASKEDKLKLKKLRA